MDWSGCTSLQASLSLQLLVSEELDRHPLLELEALAFLKAGVYDAEGLAGEVFGQDVINVTPISLRR